MMRALAFAALFPVLAVPALADESRMKLGDTVMPPAPPAQKLSIRALAAPTDRPALEANELARGVSVDDWQSRARQGDPEANYRLGLKHLAGDVMPRDLVEAFARIRLAAEAGHQRAIGLFYSIGATLTAAEHDRAFGRAESLRLQAERAPAAAPLRAPAATLSIK